AEGGTLFLDEIGNIPIEVQEKILRVVEYNTFERVGSSQSIKVDVRIIAATNADLAALSDKHLFKQDLLDRLSFEVLFLPPLRDRKGDILLLSKHFAARMRRLNAMIGREIYESSKTWWSAPCIDRMPSGLRRSPLTPFTHRMNNVSPP
ncbi:MAG: sigma 54-interacting transcriptional regulator, partial [Planctomycetota bacterium]